VTRTDFKPNRETLCTRGGGGKGEVAHDVCDTRAKRENCSRKRREKNHLSATGVGAPGGKKKKHLS